VPTFLLFQERERKRNPPSPEKMGLGLHPFLTVGARDRFSSLSSSENPTGGIKRGSSLALETANRLARMDVFLKSVI
jgi:hypothetical protein